MTAPKSAQERADAYVADQESYVDGAYTTLQMEFAFLAGHAAGVEDARGLREMLIEVDRLLEGLSSGREMGTNCTTAGEKAKRYARQIQTEIRVALTRFKELAGEVCE